MERTRRTFLQASSLALGGSMLIPQDLLAGLFGRADYQMQALRGNVGIFTEQGGTIGWYLDKDGKAVVDAQFPEQAGHLIEEIKARYPGSIDLLINTHHHGDHTAGNIAFKGLVKKVVAHSNCLKNQKRVADSREEKTEELYPDTTYEKTWSQKVGSETVTLRYYGRAHTDGDSVVRFEHANVIHMGDLIFNRRHPYIDRGAGASVENWIRVLEQVRDDSDEDTIFIFGHAGEGFPVTGNRADLKAQGNYLSGLLEFVSKGIDEGKSADEIAGSSDSLPGAEEWTGNGLERNIRTAYQELTEG
jgi:cyclase